MSAKPDGCKNCRTESPICTIANMRKEGFCDWMTCTHCTKLSRFGRLLVYIPPPP